MPAKNPVGFLLRVIFFSYFYFFIFNFIFRRDSK